MKKKDALIIEPFYRHVGLEGFWMPDFEGKWEDMGISLLKGNLDKHGYDCDIIGGRLCKNQEDFQAKLQDKLGNYSYMTLLINGGHGHGGIREALNSINVIKKLQPNIFVVMGGSLASLWARKIITDSSHIDLVVIGVGEEKIIYIIDEIKKGTRSFALIDGICYRNGEQIVYKENKNIIDFDTFGFMDRSGLKDILKMDGQARILASRGCLGGCSFCIYNKFHGVNGASQWIPRTPQNIVDEMEMLMEKYNIYSFEFYDDDFLGCCREGKERALVLCRELNRRKLNIYYSFDCRIDEFDRELFLLMKQNGLFKVFIGLESVDEKDLKIFNKRYDMSTEDILAVVFEINKLEILLDIGLMWYHPLSSYQGLIKNLDFMKKVREAALVSGSPLYVVPGTNIAKIYKNSHYVPDRKVEKVDEMMKKIMNYTVTYESKIARELKKCKRLNAPLMQLDYHQNHRFRCILWQIERQAKNFYIDYFEYSIINYHQRDIQASFKEKFLEKVEHILSLLATAHSTLEAITQKYRRI